MTHPRNTLAHAIQTPPSKRADRPRVILLHGIGGRAKAWEPVMRLGEARDWASLAWDMPGYGNSPALAVMDFNGLSDALHALIAGKGPVVLVGHSLGGMIALQHMARHPGEVAALVLVASSPAFGHADGDFQRDFIAQRLAPLQAGRTLSEVALSLLPRLCAPGYQGTGLALAHACMASVSPQAYEQALRALVQFDQRAVLPSLAVPTLCVAGEHDTAAPPEVVARMASKIPNAESVCMTGVGHLLNLEDPPAFSRVLFDFLEKHFP